MKIKKYLLIALLVLLYNQNLISQNYNEPYIINSIVGDTITKTERDNYILFKDIEGFNWAVVYLKPDSMLDAHVNYQVGNIQRDTLIENYKSLKSFDYHIKAKYTLDNKSKFVGWRKSKDSLEILAKGSEIKIIKLSGEEKQGELLAVRSNSILMYNPDCNQDNLVFPECVWKENESEISKVIIEGKSNIALGIGLGLLASVVAGIIIYDSNYEEDKKEGLFDIDFSHIDAFKKSLLPILVATISLTTIGGLIGLEFSTPDTELNIIDDADFQGLSKYARYPNEEPTHLKKIE